jgi:AcrR family transcriptional regulator
MLEAIVTLVGQQGYAATTVADVIALGEASRRTFYQHFSDRQDCLLIAAGELTASWVAVCDSAVDLATQRGDSPVEAFVTELFAAALASPSALRLLLTDLGGAGCPGIEHHRRLLEGLGRSLGRALGLSVEHTTEAPRDSTAAEALVAQALAGAILHIPYTRALRGARVGRPRRSELLALVPEVARWASSYSSTATPRLVADSRVPPAGGRAPGTLSLATGADQRRALARNERGLSRSFVVHNQRERILDAIANLSAAKGYAAVSIPELVSEAAVSVEALYEHFTDKEDALLVAYQLGHRKALALTERAYDAQGSWTDAVHAAVATLLSFLASEPSFAHVALIDMPAASGRLAALSNQGAATYAEFLKPGLEKSHNGQPPPSISAEASTNAVHALCRLHLLEGKPREMAALVDLAAHLALAPFAPAG